MDEQQFIYSKLQHLTDEVQLLYKMVEKQQDSIESLMNIIELMQSPAYAKKQSDLMDNIKIAEKLAMVRNVIKSYE